MSNDSIIKKIKALRAKSSNAASTEAEMEAAIKTAAKLMAKYEIVESDLRDRGVEGIVEGCSFKHNHHRNIFIETISYQIGKYTEVKTYIRAGSFIAVGTEADVQFALYIAELTLSSCGNAWRKHRKEQFGKLKHSQREYFRKSYFAGYATSCEQMLRTMTFEREKAKREKAKNDTGTDLVVLKNALSQDYVDKMWNGVGESSALPEIDIDFKSYFVGKDEGEKLEIHNAIE